MANKIKKKNFYQIQGWMIDLADKYDLKDKELIVYAIIYGFSQDGKSWFSGSLAYIGNWLRIDQRNVYSRYIQPLLDKKLLLREKVVFNGDVYSYKYQAIIPSDISFIDEDDNNYSQNESSTHKCEEYSQNESTLKMRDKYSQNESSTTLKMRDNNIYNNNIYNNSTNAHSSKTEEDKQEIDGMLVNKEQAKDINELVKEIGRHDINSTKPDLYAFLHKIYNKNDNNFYVKGEKIDNLKGFVKSSFVKRTNQQKENNINNKFNKEEPTPVYDTSNNIQLDENRFNEIMKNRNDKKTNPFF